MTPLQTMEFEDALERPIPVPFAKPFDSFLAVHSHQGNSWSVTEEGWILNRGLEVGIAASRCLAACTLAMLEQRLSYAATEEYRQLSSMSFFKEEPVNTDVSSFLSRLFAFVEKERLIEGFYAPTKLNDCLNVTGLSADWDMTPSAPSEKEGNIWRNPGSCGRLIKQWPLQNEDVTS
jgi:hypothetical protein